MDTRKDLRKAKRIVVKVGTSTITHETGKMNLFRMEKLVRELAGLANEGKEIILVTSGAIAVGQDRMGLKEKPKAIPARQALAAIGQGILMHVYEKLFAEYGQTAAQVLLTKENSARHHQYMNSRNALLSILKLHAVPVINENDAIAVDEIKIGDNDTLSATVATLVDADLLIILSDIDGLYTGNPQSDKNAEFIPEIHEVTPAIEKMAGGAGSQRGTGGMYTKLQAAKIAVNSGVNMVIASGAQDGAIREIIEGHEVGTLFRAKELHLRVRKSWLAFGKRLSGDLIVDAGCERAMLEDGSSLLAAGILSVDGEFKENSTVRVLSSSGREIARGIVNYDADVLCRLIGRKTNEFPELLQGKIHEEVIHRDNMVLMV